MASKKFENMTKAEQRVAIAKDVIEQIHLGRIKAIKGKYLQNTRGGCVSVTRPPKKCRACALGSMFVGRFDLTNGGWEELYDVASGTNFKEGGLDEFFSRSQLNEIEWAFEGWVKDEDGCEEFDENHPWVKACPNDEDRLIAIMQNIIDHKGIFKSSVLYEVK